MATRISALLAALLDIARAQTPVVGGVAWDVPVWGPANPCPFPASGAFRCTDPTQRLTVIGSGFGPTTGVIQFDGPTGYTPPPFPAPQVPDDASDSLQPAAMTNNDPSNCAQVSVYADEDFAFAFCPYANVSLLDKRSGNALVTSLGSYQGVVRSPVPPSAGCDNGVAITSMIFAAGPMCNGAPRTTNVTFTCIDMTAPDQGFYTASPQIYSAISADGCNWAMDFAMVAACRGPGYDMCADPGSVPNPSPSPAPAWGYATTAFIDSWSDGRVVAYAANVTVAPATVRVVTSGGSSSSGTGPVPQPFPASRSPIPVPFPMGIKMLGMEPQYVPVGGGTLVTVMLAGVTSERDMVGLDPTFRISWPIGNGPTDTSTPQNMLGGPKSVDGSPPFVAANGLLNVTFVTAPQPTGFNGPYFVTVVSASFVVGPPQTWQVNQQASCAGSATTCTLFYGAPQPSQGPAEASGGGIELTPAVVGGAAAGVVVFLLLLAGVARYASRPARAVPGAGSGGAEDWSGVAAATSSPPDMSSRAARAASSPKLTV